MYWKNKRVQKQLREQQVRRIQREWPFKRGVVIRTVKCSPKKPNSGKRRVLKMRLVNGWVIRAMYRGAVTDLPKYAKVMVRYGRTRSVVGLHFVVVNGKLNAMLPSTTIRTNRSKYGLPTLPIRKAKYNASRPSFS